MEYAGYMMPGPVSDSYDCEFGTSANAAEISEAVMGMHAKLSRILKNSAPIYAVQLVKADLPEKITATLTEKEWRILRFACERAAETI